MVNKLFDLKTKKEFTKELKKSISENRIDLEYIDNIFREYGRDLEEELEVDLGNLDDYFDDHIEDIPYYNSTEFSFKLTGLGRNELIISIGNIEIFTRDKDKILEVLQSFVSICESLYDEHIESCNSDEISNFLLSDEEKRVKEISTTIGSNIGWW